MFGFGYTGIIASMKKLPSGGANGALTTAWIAATGETDLTILGALNTLETDLTTYGLTAKMTALYPFAGGSSTKHSYNFINTAAYQLSFVGGWTHSSTGALPNGTNAYANTGILASSFGTDYMLNFYSRTNSSGLYSDLGTYNETSSSNVLEVLTSLSSTCYIDIPYVGQRETFANADSRGNYLFLNNSSNGYKAYLNSTQKLSLAHKNIAITNKNLIFSDWGYLVSPRYSNRQLAFGGFGAGFTATDAANYYTAVQAFQTTLGRQV